LSQQLRTNYLTHTKIPFEKIKVLTSLKNKKFVDKNGTTVEYVYPSTLTSKFEAFVLMRDNIYKMVSRNNKLKYYSNICNLTSYILSFNYASPHPTFFQHVIFILARACHDYIQAKDFEVPSLNFHSIITEYFKNKGDTVVNICHFILLLDIMLLVYLISKSSKASPTKEELKEIDHYNKIALKKVKSLKPFYPLTQQQLNKFKA
jgi:hypothetical protein